MADSLTAAGGSERRQQRLGNAPLSAPVACVARSAQRELRAVRLMLPGPVTMPDHIKSSELSVCEEREAHAAHVKESDINLTSQNGDARAFDGMNEMRSETQF